MVELSYVSLRYYHKIVFPCYIGKISKMHSCCIKTSDKSTTKEKSKGIACVADLSCVFIFGPAKYYFYSESAVNRLNSNSDTLKNTQNLWNTKTVQIAHANCANNKNYSISHPKRARTFDSGLAIFTTLTLRLWLLFCLFLFLVWKNLIFIRFKIVLT